MEREKDEQPDELRDFKIWRRRGDLSSCTSPPAPGTENTPKSAPSALADPPSPPARLRMSYYLGASSSPCVSLPPHPLHQS